MAKKISVSRSFTFKAYKSEKGEITLESVNAKKCEFMFKSACHYYAEKYILDFINDNFDIAKKCKFAIFKVYDQDLTNAKDFEIEQIYVKNDKICID